LDALELHHRPRAPDLESLRPHTRLSPHLSGSTARDVAPSLHAKDPTSTDTALLVRARRCRVAQPATAPDPGTKLRATRPMRTPGGAPTHPVRGAPTLPDPPSEIMQPYRKDTSNNVVRVAGRPALRAPPDTPHPVAAFGFLSKWRVGACTPREHQDGIARDSAAQQPEVPYRSQENATQHGAEGARAGLGAHGGGGRRPGRRGRSRIRHSPPSSMARQARACRP